MVVVGAAVMALLGSAGVLWTKGSQWLVEHQMLVDASEASALAVPGMGGAGLDTSRLMVIAGVLIIVLAVAGSAARVALTRGKGHSE